MAQVYPPKKNAAFDLYFPLYGNNLTPQTGAAGLDSEVSKDGAAFADCTNEATEIGATGIYKLTLTATEMNADIVVVQVKTTSLGTVVFTLYTGAATWDEHLLVGSGGLSKTIDVTSGGLPVDGASVWVSTDVAGANVVVGPLTTDAAGRVTVLLDAGNYYVWVQKSGYSAVEGDAIVVA